LKRIEAARACSKAPRGAGDSGREPLGTRRRGAHAGGRITIAWSAIPPASLSRARLLWSIWSWRHLVSAQYRHHYRASGNQAPLRDRRLAAAAACA